MFSLPFQALSMRIRIFSSVQTKTVSRRFQKLDSGDRFRKPAFLVPENADYVRTQSLFSKISGYLWTGHWNQVLKSLCRSLS